MEQDSTLKMKKVNKKKEVEIRKILLASKCEFRFSHFENAQNLSQALELGGYFCKLSRQDGGYLVEVYEY